VIRRKRVVNSLNDVRECRRPVRVRCHFIERRELSRIREEKNAIAASPSRRVRPVQESEIVPSRLERDPRRIERGTRPRIVRREQSRGAEERERLHVAVLSAVVRPDFETHRVTFRSHSSREEANLRRREQLVRSFERRRREERSRSSDGIDPSRGRRRSERDGREPEDILDGVERDRPVVDLAETDLRDAEDLVDDFERRPGEAEASAWTILPRAPVRFDRHFRKRVRERLQYASYDERRRRHVRDALEVDRLRVQCPDDDDVRRALGGRRDVLLPVLRPIRESDLHFVKRLVPGAAREVGSFEDLVDRENMSEMIESASFGVSMFIELPSPSFARILAA
jgi:hypothetical protein